MPYWYNVDTGEVETDETRSKGATVMGPYETQDAASHALETAHARTEQWDAEDRAWETGGSAADEAQED
jgi:hypothetical protein